MGNIYKNYEICSKCGGICCKTLGCHYSPKDFKDLSYEGLKKEINNGYISIDWYEGNPFKDDRYIPRALFLRIRNIDASIVDPSWGGTCSLLTDKGCKLSFDERPTGGKSLIPVDRLKGDCILTYSKQDCAKDWYKYNDILLKLENYYYNKDIKNKYQYIYK